MSSSFLCECGQRIDKNLFSGNRVALLIPEEDVDRDLSGISAEDFVADLIKNCVTVVRCTSCSRLYLVGEGDKDAIHAFIPDMSGLGSAHW